MDGLYVHDPSGSQVFYSQRDALIGVGVAPACICEDLASGRPVGPRAGLALAGGGENNLNDEWDDWYKPFPEDRHGGRLEPALGEARLG